VAGYQWGRSTCVDEIFSTAGATLQGRGSLAWISTAAEGATLKLLSGAPVLPRQSGSAGTPAGGG